MLHCKKACHETTSPPSVLSSFPQTVEEIEGALGRDFYPSLSEERVRWEKELAGLREENESLTAMLCSKEEDLNRTKATMNAIREERDRLRRRVSQLGPVIMILLHFLSFGLWILCVSRVPFEPFHMTVLVADRLGCIVAYYC